MAPVQPLTKRQREIYDFIAKFIRDVDYAPSLEEIAAAMHLSALATVHKHLQNLTEKGYITRTWNRSRSIALTMNATRCPTCGRDFEAKVPLETGRNRDTVGSTSDASTSSVPTTTEVP